MTPQSCLEILWLLIPAGFSNMAPVFAAKLLPSWNYPVDLGYGLHGRRIFGSHKTMRGLVAGAIAGELSFLGLRFVVANFVPEAMQPRLAFLHIPVYFGFWIGLCA